MCSEPSTIRMELDDAPVLVVGRVEDQRPQRRLGVALGRRDAGDDGVEQLGHPLPRLGRDVQDGLGRQSQHVLDLERAADRVGRRQVDLVEDRHDLEIVLDGLVAVGQRLGLNALGGVDQEHGPLAGRQRAGDLVAEVDVAGGVDQVEDVAGVHDPDVLGLDGDPPLPLDVHGVEVLLPHEAGVDGPGDLENAVGQGRLAVVDMADDGEVANLLDRNGSGCGDGGRHGPSIVPAQVGDPGRLARELGVSPSAWRRPK